MAPSGQYANALDHQPVTSGDKNTSISEVCYSTTDHVAAVEGTKTFTITGAHNDALSEEGIRATEAEFDKSSTLKDIKRYVGGLKAETAITQIDVHGTASDDNRANVNAGIGEQDEINQRTARSYTSIATTALKKLFSGKKAPTFTQSAEEKILNVAEQQKLDEVQEKAGYSAKTDLLSVYNDIESVLDSSDRAVIDEVLGKHRGVEITVHTNTPEHTLVETHCTPIAPEMPTNDASDERQPAPVTLYGDPQAILPQWSRVTKNFSLPPQEKKQELYGLPTFKQRTLRRVAAIGQSLKHDWSVVKEDAQFIKGGLTDIAGMIKIDSSHYAGNIYKTWVLNEPARLEAQHEYGSYSRPAPKTRRERVLRPLNDTASVIKEEFQNIRQSAPKKTKRFIRRTNEKFHNVVPSIHEVADGVKSRQAEANRMAAIPSADLRKLSRVEFVDKHGVFPEDFHRAQHTTKTMPLRRFIQKRIKRAK